MVPIMGNKDLVSSVAQEYDANNRRLGSVTDVNICYTKTPNSYRLINSPITISCIFSNLEKQIVFRTNRLMRVERVKKPSLIMFYILTMEDALCQGLGTGESCFNIILIIEI